MEVISLPILVGVEPNILMVSFPSLPFSFFNYHDDLSAFGSSIVFSWLDYHSGTKLAVAFH